jgi:Diacylglycerol acyltransferase
MNVDAYRNITAPITGFFHRGLLFLNTLVTIPIYSILYFKILYWTSLYYAYHYNRYILTGLLAYTVYIILDPSPKRGGWSHFPSKWQRWCNNFTCFRLLAEFFDAKIIREKELDPKQQYLFMYHPHGLISVGLCATLATNGADFEANFPGVSIIVLG